LVLKINGFSLNIFGDDGGGDNDVLELKDERSK